MPYSPSWHIKYYIGRVVQTGVHNNVGGRPVQTPPDYLITGGSGVEQ